MNRLSEANTDNKRIWLHRLRRVLYWVIPIVLFYVILRSIDLETLGEVLSQTNLWLVALGICITPLATLIGALRWRYFLARFHEQAVSYRFVFKHYWIGLALGRFAPSSIGMDVYRVMVSGQRYGRYGLNTAIAFVEKLIALVGAMALIIVLYPLVPIQSSPDIAKIFSLAYLLFFASLLSIVALALLQRSRFLSPFLERLELYSAGLIARTGARLGMGDRFKDRSIPFREMIAPVASPGRLLPALLFSFGIQLASALRVQIFFQAVGYEIPFAVNLFVAPVMYFISHLPLSVGGFGVREASYILLYGLFGVPSEIALIISLFSFTGGLFNLLVAGTVMLLSRVRGEDLPQKTFPDEPAP